MSSNKLFVILVLRNLSVITIVFSHLLSHFKETYLLKRRVEIFESKIFNV